MRNQLLLPASLVLVLSMALAQSSRPKDDGWAELLPPGEGRALVQSSCSGNCHNMKIVVHARKSRPDWAKCINDMIQRGAPVFADEIEPMTAYLAKSFGDAVPRLVNVNTAARGDLEKLPNLKPEVVTRILEARAKAGRFRNAEELRQGLSLPKEDFEKIVYSFKYID